jgi:hypothetical protein
MTDASATPSTTCPACGASASGRFCQQCGAALGARACARCQATMRAGARFCHRCGTPASGAGAPAGPQVSPSKTPWLVAGILVIAAIALVTLQGVNKNNPPAQPVMPNAGNSAPFAGGAAGGAGGAGGPSQVDIANMSPQERFNRLFNRVMRAAGSGDTAQAIQFAPMAGQAYGMLDRADFNADTRLHMGLILVVQKDAAGVRAIADTILEENPDHLFGYILRGDAARLAGNDAEFRKAVADYRAREQKELARTDRVEYQEHQPLLAEFNAAAAK